ncbi:OPT oligopeptide transporter [Gymnopilus junonius]|uniref:OPT oligopeptide transporter n=1 Tax=Gymnopilus junonius TaxID=109634 RepID=A0A9P5TMM7_GYMJU|nr:OPT oligopeptide transporter [Gymnopilus junonius]
MPDDDSPYPEVRSAVSNTDDSSMPVSTVRSWVIGILWSILIPGLNQFFYLRYPSVGIGGIVAQLLSFPLGRAWASCVPNVTFFGIPLNPGPYHHHGIVGAGTAYATDVIAVQRVYYNQIFNFGLDDRHVDSTYWFSIGGISRRFLVDPPSMIWPANLVICALFNTLHSQTYAGIGDRKGLSRERFFFYCFVGSAVYYFFPGYLFQALSTFSWVCWIAPDNVIINQMFGYFHGLGMSLFSFDWAQIAYIGSPLATPWWAEANIVVGFLLFYWIFTPLIYYTNTWYTQYLPMSTRNSYDNTGNPYNVTRIINPDASLNIAEYKNYSPLFLSATFAVSYGLSFATITATLTHAFFFYGRQIWTQARRSLYEQPDVHARLMSRYARVPEWYYGLTFVSMFIFAVISIEILKTELPIWAFLLALSISFIYVIPCGIIQAITNQQIGLNVIAELIVGYALPGRPVAMMLFKTWGYITMTQALTFSSDFKLGHYMKIPPRTMFFAQVICAVIAGTVQLAVQSWMFTNIEGLCSPDQESGFICPFTEVFGTASIIWGVIGPARQFSKGQIYYIPVILAGTNALPPANAVNYVTWGMVGFVFQYIIRKRHFAWWTKYNYVLSAALDSGVAIGVILIFFCLQYPNNGAIGKDNIQTWWGNAVYVTTADYLGTPLRILNSGQARFGPSTW